MRHRLIVFSLWLIPACTPGAPAAAPNCPPAVQREEPKVTEAPKTPAATALDPELAPYAFLLGDWEGLSADQELGAFSFETQVQGHVMVRHNKARVKEGMHEDLLTMYATLQGEVRALYVDNENHVIQYAVSATENPKGAVFVSDEVPGAGRFRLAYELQADGSVRGSFQIAPPGKTEFRGYLAWTAKKK